MLSDLQQGSHLGVPRAAPRIGKALQRPHGPASVFFPRNRGCLRWLLGGEATGAASRPCGRPGAASSPPRRPPAPRPPPRRAPSAPRAPRRPGTSDQTSAVRPRRRGAGRTGPAHPRHPCASRRGRGRERALPAARRARLRKIAARARRPRAASPRGSAAPGCVEAPRGYRGAAARRGRPSREAARERRAKYVSTRFSTGFFRPQVFHHHPTRRAWTRADAAVGARPSPL